jgi:hypothetical protein
VRRIWHFARRALQFCLTFTKNRAILIKIYFCGVQIATIGNGIFMSRIANTSYQYFFCFTYYYGKALFACRNGAAEQ